MKRFWSFLLVLLAISYGCDCGDEVKVSFSCPPPEECFVIYGKENKEKNIITGNKLTDYKNSVCSFGTTSCDERSETITCEGIKYTTEEICDGADNDCNGVVDDPEILFVESFHPQNPCRETEVGVCRNSDAQCIMGEWICIPPSELYGQEVCDGRDNDCDGEIDEDIEEVFVYNGNPQTLNVGECRAGVQKCENGSIETFGMVTPIVEICGNGDDDDCDGLTDEMENDPQSYDFALLLDVSGSMIQYLYSVNFALCDWASTTRLQNSRFSIVAIATSHNETGIHLVTDFVDSTQACQALDSFLLNVGGTVSYEFQLDAILRSMTVGDDLDLSWSGNREKRIVLFTDEEPQWQFEGEMNNISFPTLEEKILEITESCSTTNTTISVFSPWGVHWNVVWDEIVSFCGGYLEYLVFSPQQMIERLNYWFGEEC